MKSIWDNIGLEIKNKIRTSAFNALVNKNDNIKRGASKLIAAIFALDKLNEKQWDIIINLTENVNHEDMEI